MGPRNALNCEVLKRRALIMRTCDIFPLSEDWGSLKRGLGAGPPSPTPVDLLLLTTTHSVEKWYKEYVTV